MVDISIQSGQGITQAIKAKIEGSGQKISNNDLSVWQDVMREVKTAQESGSQIYSGGDDVDQLNNKQNWKTDFKVAAGQVIQLVENVWNRIVELLTGKKPEVAQETPKEPPKLEKSEVKLAPEPKIDNPPELDIAELPQEVRKELTEATLDEIGAKTFTREVNGEKQEIAVLRDEDGNKVRRLINEDGTMGETLVPVSTFGKNKYITQTKMDDMIKNVFPEGLPEGVTASFVTIGGTPQLVFKKDGQTLDQAQLRELVKEQSNNSVSGVSVQSAEVNNAEVINGSAVQQSETLASPAAEPINQEPVEHNINNEKTVGTYTFLPDGNGGYRLDAKMQLFGGPEANKFFKTMSIGSGNKAEYDKKTGQYSFRGISSNSRQGLNDILMNISNQVSMNNAIYKDLLSKQQSGVELSDVEKKFMEDHLESLKQYNLGVDAQGNLIDTTQETHRRRGRR